MKYLLSLLFLSVNLMAIELHWHDDYNAALREAKKEHKLVYIFISSSQCGWCQKFEKTTLQDEVVKKRLSKEFITLHLIRDFDEVPKKFKTSPVPRHYFTDANGNILYNSLGYRKVECFNSFMDNAEQKFKITK